MFVNPTQFKNKALPKFSRASLLSAPALLKKVNFAKLKHSRNNTSTTQPYISPSLKRQLRRSICVTGALYPFYSCGFILYSACEHLSIIANLTSISVLTNNCNAYFRTNSIHITIKFLKVSPRQSVGPSGTITKCISIVLSQKIAINPY